MKVDDVDDPSRYPPRPADDRSDRRNPDRISASVPRARPWRPARTIAIAAGLVIALGLLIVVAYRRGDRQAPGDGSAPIATSGVSPACPAGHKLFVSPDGAATAPGTREEPLDLKTALSLKGPAKPCDTVWLLGGTYAGTFTSDIHGTQGAPIVVRQYPGERAILDSAPSHDPALTVNGSHVWFWGFEVTNSNTQRTSAEPATWPGDLPRGTGVAVSGAHAKLINLAIHDLARGIEVGANATALELYGDLIYANGWEGPQTSSGNGIETRNRGPRQVIAESIIFNQYSHGILALGSDTMNVDNLTLEGNTVFNNGLPGRSGFARDILVGGSRPAANPVLRDNSTYGGAQTYVGYGHGCENASVTGNYFVGSSALLLEKCTATVTENILFGKYGFGTLPQLYPQNTYLSTRPFGVVIRQRPNSYEPGRAVITVYNWDRKPSVSVDLTKSGLATGDVYEIRDAENFFGTPVVSGTVGSDKIVELRMSDLRGVSPIGRAGSLAHTAPEFGVFVVQRPPARRMTRREP